MAKYLVENETTIFVGLLMLRDALKEPGREVLAERFIKDYAPEFNRNHAIIVGGDTSLIDKHRDIIDY